MTPLSKNSFLITGGGRGLGRAAARALGAQGARVMINDINPDSAAETARLVEAAGGQASVHVADISKKFPVQAMFNAVEDAWGGIAGLVNNARVVPHQAVLDMDDWDWRRTQDVNLTGAFILTQVAGRILRASGGGTIVHLLQEAENDSGLAAYRAALSGLEAFAAAAEAEMREAGVACAVVTYGAGVYEKAVGEIMSLLEEQASR